MSGIGTCDSITGGSNCGYEDDRVGELIEGMNDSAARGTLMMELALSHEEAEQAVEQFRLTGECNIEAILANRDR